MQNEPKELTGGAMCQNQNIGIVVPTTVVQNLTPEKECPNCGKDWSSEEIDLQCCDDCGYPLHKEQNAFNPQVFDFSAIEYLH